MGAEAVGLGTRMETGQSLLAFEGVGNKWVQYKGHRESPEGVGSRVAGSVNSARKRRPNLIIAIVATIFHARLI